MAGLHECIEEHASRIRGEQGGIVRIYQVRGAAVGINSGKAHEGAVLLLVAGRIKANWLAILQIIRIAPSGIGDFERLDSGAVGFDRLKKIDPVCRRNHIARGKPADLLLVIGAEMIVEEIASIHNFIRIVILMGCATGGDVNRTGIHVYPAKIIIRMVNPQIMPHFMPAIVKGHAVWKP